MKKLTCIVVDDQSFCIRLLTDHIKKFEDLKLLETFTDPTIAREYLQNQPHVDILFTDVDMYEMSGIALAESVEGKVNHIVFVTSHFKHELKPNLEKKWHYLFKPTSLSNFRELFQQLQNEAEI